MKKEYFILKISFASQIIQPQIATRQSLKSDNKNNIPHKGDFSLMLIYFIKKFFCIKCLKNINNRNLC
jgi:hypothetical protein